MRVKPDEAQAQFAAPRLRPAPRPPGDATPVFGQGTLLVLCKGPGDFLQIEVAGVLPAVVEMHAAFLSTVPHVALCEFLKFRLPNRGRQWTVEARDSFWGDSDGELRADVPTRSASWA